MFSSTAGVWQEIMPEVFLFLEQAGSWDEFLFMFFVSAEKKNILSFILLLLWKIWKLS